MSYVLVWPSEIGPCMLEVSERVFWSAVRRDVHADHVARSLRYPPPAWTRVVGIPAFKGFRLHVFLRCVLSFGLGLFLGAFAAGIFSGSGGLDYPPMLQPVQAKLIV